ncbi:MAG: hypothetical protein K1W18_07170 [Oscillospiraceae bacterium]
MTKTEMRKLAKDMLMHQLSAVLYQFENPCYEDIPEKFHEEISKYIYQYGTAMGKAIGEEFYA